MTAVWQARGEGLGAGGGRWGMARGVGHRGLGLTLTPVKSDSETCSRWATPTCEEGGGRACGCGLGAGVGEVRVWVRCGCGLGAGVG